MKISQEFEVTRMEAAGPAWTRLWLESREKPGQLGESVAFAVTRAKSGALMIGTRVWVTVETSSEV